MAEKIQEAGNDVPIRTIVLPELFWSKRHPLGDICHVVRPSHETVVTETSTIRVSPRIEEPLLLLQSGEKVILTNRRACPHPEGVDGVLLQNEDGKHRWLSHRLLEGQDDAKQWERLKADISSSWLTGIRYAAERSTDDGKTEIPGLRPPQIGALTRLVLTGVCTEHPPRLLCLPVQVRQKPLSRRVLARFTALCWLSSHPRRYARRHEQNFLRSAC